MVYMDRNRMGQPNSACGIIYILEERACLDSNANTSTASLPIRAGSDDLRARSVSSVVAAWQGFEFSKDTFCPPWLIVCSSHVYAHVYARTDL